VAAQAPAVSLEQQYLQGEYEAVASRWEKANKGSSWSPAQWHIWGLSALELGRYEDAQVASKRMGKSRSLAPASVALQGRIMRARGQHKALISAMRKEVRKRPTHWEARILLSEALLATGTGPSDLVEADEMADYWNDGQIKAPQDLRWLGRALHLTGYFQDAFDMLNQTLDQTPNDQQALAFLIELLMDKEDETQAGAVLGRLLKVNPNHMQGRIWAAHMDISSDNDYAAARKRIQAVLKSNAKHVSALQEEASALIHTEQYEAALVSLNRALTVNSRDLKTLALVATCHELLEQAKEARAVVKRALAVHPRAAVVYHTMAEYLVIHHRYRDAVDLERKAIELDPEYWPAVVGLGIGYSRLGDDERANQYLQLAFEHDSYNRRAYNMTALFYDGPAKKMTWHSVSPFRLRLDRKEAPVLEPLLVPFLEKAYEHHRTAYGYRPEKPLHIEIFPDPTTFSIRTTGFPRLGAHGVCFGHVVTAQSPSAGNFNWGMVLWHELAHVWHIQMSDSRVPRWFTEGLAEHETTLQRPEWRREMDYELWEALNSGQLKGVAEFNTMFTQAKSFREIVLAYYFASKVVAFIDHKWGFEVFPRMLLAWGEKRPTEVVFKQVLGVDLATFDAQVRADLKTRVLARFTHEFSPDRSTAPKEILVAYKAGLEALKKNKNADAALHFDAVLASGAEGSRLRSFRALAALGLKQWKEARRHLDKATAIDDMNIKAYRLLAGVLEQLKDEDARYLALQRIATLEEHDAKAAVDVAIRAQERGDVAIQDRFSRQAIEVGPFETKVRLLRIRAILDKGNAKAAQTRMDRLPPKVLQTWPDAKRLRARVLIALGRSTEAKSLLEAMEQTDRVKALLDTIR